MKILISKIMEGGIDLQTMKEVSKPPSMFPYFKNQEDSTKTLMRDALKQWTGNKVLRVRPMQQTGDKPTRFRSSLARGRKKVEERERLRREGRLRKVK